MILRFDEFGWRSLEAEAARRGQSLPELVCRALGHFLAELRAPRFGLIAPRFKPSTAARAHEISFELPDRPRELFESEAERQGIPLERLLEHAKLLYLADVDSGRVSDHAPNSSCAGK